jgi:hypothetical protein
MIIQFGPILIISMEQILQAFQQILTVSISPLMATSIADLSSLLLANRYGFLVSKNFKQYLWPYSEQKWHGVFPSMSLAFISALC